MKRGMTPPARVCLSLALALVPALAHAQARAPEAVQLVAPTGSVSRRPVLRGVAAPGRTVRLSLDGRPLGAVRAARDGAWVFVPPSHLRDGRHAVGAWSEGSDPLGTGAARQELTVARCEGSAACGGATPVCELNVGRCVACESDSECVDPSRPRCSRGGESAGMCLAEAPRVTSPEAGYAVGGAQRVVAGTALALATVAVLVDDVEVGRTSADAQGRWRFELPAVERAWHQVSAAHVEDGVVGVRGEGRRFLAVACASDEDCGGGGRCEVPAFVCGGR
jgi:hypothetical protein